MNAARLRWTLPPVLWFGMTVVLLTLPGESFPDMTLWGRDKLAHGVLFGFQALLFWLALELPRPVYASHRRALLVAAVVTSLWGGVSEIYQLFCTNRAASVWDFCANVGGVLLLLVALRIIGPHTLLRRLAPHLP